MKDAPMAAARTPRNLSRAGSLLACVATALLMQACGGGGDDAVPAPEPVPAPAPAPAPAGPERGTLIEGRQESDASIPKELVDLLVSVAELSDVTDRARCNIDVHYVRYHTRDPLNEPHTASAAILLPTGGDPAVCQGPRPVVLYARGTDTKKSKNMVDWENEAESLLTMAFFAAQGQVVVLPNYLGHDTSSLPYHPFLNAEAQAVDMVDGLRAAKTYLATTSGTRIGDKLFVTGYSQGGHVAMATQRTIERDHVGEFAVTASAPMSGPYNMVRFGDVIASREEERINDGATVLLTLLLTSYQKSYGDIYATPSQAYNPPYDLTAETLFPTDTPLDTLVAQGLLPADDLAVWVPGGLLQDSFRTAYPTSAFRRALQLNTLLDWTPQAPMAMCGGAEDPVVFFDINTRDAQAAFAARGVAVAAFDLEDRATLPDGTDADAVASSFVEKKATGDSNYHAGLVAPHCMALVSQFFARF
jgi:hypothetical protein